MVVLRTVRGALASSPGVDQSLAAPARVLCDRPVFEPFPRVGRAERGEDGVEGVAAGVAHDRAHVVRRYLDQLAQPCEDHVARATPLHREWSALRLLVILVGEQELFERRARAGFDE